MTEVTSGTYQRGQMGQSAPRTLEQFAPLLQKYAVRFHKRATGLGCPIDYEDIMQELSMTFLRCVDSYDEAKGGSFMNYTISAMYHEMNRVMGRDQRRADGGNIVLQQSALDADIESGESIFDRIQSGCATPEQTVEAAQTISRLLDALSPQARTLVETLIDPSDEVMNQFDLQLRGVRALRERGETVRAVLHLDLRFLTHLFKIPRRNATQLHEEIRAKAAVFFDLEPQS